MRNITIILFLLLVSGCSLVHKHETDTLQPALPAEFPYRQNNISEHTLDRWWENFANEDLNSFMAQAFSGNFDIKLAVARMKQTQSLYQQSRAGSLPWLNLEAGGGRNRQPGLVGAITDSTYQASLIAGYEIDIWGKIRSQQRAAYLRSEASEAEIRSLFLSLSAQVAETWFRISELQEQLTLTDAIIMARKDSLHHVERRYKAGLTTSLDVYQARQSLNAARTKRPQNTFDLKTAEHALAVLAGSWPGQFPSDPSWALPDIEASFPVGLPSGILKKRPDVEVAFLQLQAADSDVAAAVANRFPSFSLTGAYGGSSNELHTLLNNSNIFWNALLSLSQSLFDGGRKKQAAKQAHYVFEERLAAYHKAILIAFRDVADALAAEEDAGKNLELQKNLYASASDTLRVSEEQYQQGLVDYLTVLTAQAAHSDSQRNLVSARRKQVAARISLARAVGGSWMDEEVKN